MAETLTLYIRRDCHLCDEMYDALQPWQAKLGFALQSIDIADDLGLIARFGDKVPVLVYRGQEICHYRLDEAALLAYLDSG
jgi:glutaredoxin